MNAPQVALKAIVIIHFVLTMWASMSKYFLPPAYIYLSAFVLVFGIWAIVNKDSQEPVEMYLILHIISVIQDIVFLGIYTGRTQDQFDREDTSLTYTHGERDVFRFCLGMAITNLIIKPVTGFLLFCILRSRSGDNAELIPGVRFPGFGGGHQGTYENIDHPSPYGSNVETATGHDVMEKPPGQP